jgi:hypothetical protein
VPEAQLVLAGPTAAGFQTVTVFWENRKYARLYSGVHACAISDFGPLTGRNDPHTDGSDHWPECAKTRLLQSIVNSSDWRVGFRPQIVCEQIDIPQPRRSENK